MSGTGRIVVVMGAVSALIGGGCAVSRHEQVRAKAERVERELTGERRRVLNLADSDATRAARLNHLTDLRLTLSAANIALAGVPLFVEEPQRPFAYDVLDEAYDAIRWNIPLLPGDPATRPMPARFRDGMLWLD